MIFKMDVNLTSLEEAILEIAESVMKADVKTTIDILYSNCKQKLPNSKEQISMAINS